MITEVLWLFKDSGSFVRGDTGPFSIVTLTLHLGHTAVGHRVLAQLILSYLFRDRGLLPEFQLGPSALLYGSAC